MLSILIPTFQYNCLPLVTELHRQADLLKIPFEIICLDDASGDVLYAIENEAINLLPFASFNSNTSNLGRAANRNLLAQKAKHEWLLFLDCDTYPSQDNFISAYVTAVVSSKDLVYFGGLAYKPKGFNRFNKLRYNYGILREAIPLSVRSKKIYTHALTSNILVHKKVFTDHKFDEKLKNYGYEDLVFIYNLQKNNIKIHHIDNAVFHLNLETSTDFIKKCEKAVENLIYIEELNLLPKNHTKIQKIGEIIKFFRLKWLFSKIFMSYKNDFIKDLTSSNPSINTLDLYKLCYYCHLKKQ